MSSKVALPSHAGSIFVSIASYRDNQCQYTIRDLFEKAAYPELVVVGVCLQVAAEDEDSFALDLDKWSGQIRTYFLKHTEAKGPCYARALIQEHLFRDEDYYFQIDSHFRFAAGWDVTCLDQLTACSSPKPILTAYASSYTLPKDYKPGGPDQAIFAQEKSMTVLCADRFGDGNNDDPFLRIKTRVCRSNFNHVPPPALVWTARFAFSAGNVVREVPYDPYLEYVFFGEEIGMSARLWTHGWDLFNPTKVIAYHLGSRAHRQWFREVQTTPEHVQREQLAKFRLCGLLETQWPEGQRHPAPTAPYCLGRARTLREYERFAGIDFANQIVHDRGRDGGVSPELLPPQWAEQEREKIAHDAQMRDVASWAGKDNHAAKAAKVACQMQSDSSATPPVNVAQEREMAMIRIQVLRGQLGSAAVAEDATGIKAAELHMDLSRAFCGLGRVASASGEITMATEACDRALEHALILRERPPCGLDADPAWMGGVAQAIETCHIGARRFDVAKGGLMESLRLATEAIAKNYCESTAVLAHDVVEDIHVCHEQTDDRSGLYKFVRPLKRLLHTIGDLIGKDPAVIPILTGADAPTSAGDVQNSVIAQMIERIVLVCIATGRDDDMAIVKWVYSNFRIARESCNLRKLLGMLQSSGHFLDGSVN